MSDVLDRLRSASAGEDRSSGECKVSASELREAVREISRLRDENTGLLATQRINARARAAQASELERLRAAIDAQWQPIGTFPFGTKMGRVHTYLLTHVEEGWVRIGHYLGETDRWYYSGTQERGQFTQAPGEAPTHWMMIPPPPGR